MALDIKSMINTVVEKVQKDPSIAKKFEENPIKAVEGIIGIDLPDDQVKQIVDAVKSKIKLDKIGGALGGLFGKK